MPHPILASEDHRDCLWYVPFDTTQLLSAYEPHRHCPVVTAAQPFTVEMRAARVEDDPHSPLYHWVHGSDGILILSNAVLGDKPTLQRVHYYADHPVAKEVINDFMAGTIYVCGDYSGHDHFWLEIRVLSVKADPQGSAALISKFNALASEAGAIFPAVMPYTLAADGVLKTVENFVDSSARNCDVIRYPVRFNPAGHGYPLLRPGSYVVFPRATQAGHFQLADNEQLVTADGADALVTHAVFTIENKNEPDPDFVTSQRVAMLLTQIDSGNQNADQASVQFVTDTLTQYGNFKDLQRYDELKSQPARSVDEQKIMDRLALRPELQPFLPKP